MTRLRDTAPRHREQPNWMRRLGRDAPAIYEFARRTQEKSAIVGEGIRKHRVPRAISDRVKPDLLPNALRGIGVQPGDVLMVHSSWNTARRLTTSPVAMVDT